MLDWKVAQTEDPFVAWHRRLETDALLAVVDRAMKKVGDGCPICGYSRTAVLYTGAGFRVEEKCKECA